MTNKEKVMRMLQEQKETVDKALAAVGEVEENYPIVEELYKLASWAEANIYDVPVNLPSVLFSAAAILELLLKEEY